MDFYRNPFLYKIDDLLLCFGDHYGTFAAPLEARETRQVLLLDSSV